jgi:hypothetical protein
MSAAAPVVGDARLGPAAGVEGIAVHAVSQLLDRLAAADESQFLVSWTEQMLTGREEDDHHGGSYG